MIGNDLRIQFSVLTKHPLVNLKKGSDPRLATMWFVTQLCALLNDGGVSELLQGDWLRRRRRRIEVDADYTLHERRRVLILDKSPRVEAFVSQIYPHM